MKYYKLVLLFLVVGCAGRPHGMETVDIAIEPICRLDESFSPIGKISSVCMIDSTRFAVVSNFETVVLYDCEGNRISQIGTPGNAMYEYNMPMIVRAHQDIIYVWSANTLRFISYSVSGEPISQYDYPSGVFDFAVADSTIYIYAAGLREDHVIDVYDMEEKKIKETLCPSSEAHQAQLSWLSCAPMAASSNGVEFMPMDALSVIRYDKDSQTIETKAAIRSKTFIIQRGKYSRMETDQLLSVLNTNSHPAMLACNQDGYWLLSQDTSGETDQWFYSSYLIRPDGSYSQKIIDYDALTSPYMFSYYNGCLYFVKSIEIEDDEEIWLMRTNDF